MSLRKSPKRTRALLAANRANSRKSAGPRTRAGRRHSAWNAVRHGRRARATCRLILVASRDLKAFTDFYFKLHDAIIPADSLAGEQAVLNKALEAWKVKRVLDRWIDRQTEEDWLVLAAGAVPPPSFWRLKLRRPGLAAPGWTVTISVWLRWGRGPRWSRPSRPKDDTKPDRPRMHTMVSVHSTGPRDVARASRPCSSRPEPALSNVKGWPCHDHGDPDSERTKPECDTMQSSSGNMSIAREWDPAYAEAYALAERIVGWLMPWGRRTEPEYSRKQATYKNISARGESTAGNPNAKSCEKFEYGHAEPGRSSAANGSFALLRTGSERGEGAQGKLREASRYFIENEMQGSFAVAQDDMHRSFSQPSSHGTTRLGRVFRAIRTAITPQKEPSQLPLLRTKPECDRKQGASKIISKSLGWLGAAASFLLETRPSMGLYLENLETLSFPRRQESSAFGGSLP